MDTNQQNPDVFSLSEGGPFNRGLERLGLHNKQGRIALVIFCITWLPLAIITAMEGTLNAGSHMPFLKDVGIQARLLIAMPLLILIKLLIDGRVTMALKYLGDVLMSPEERQLIHTTALRRARNWANSTLTEIILLLIVIVTTISLAKSGMYSGLRFGTESWMATFKEGRHALTLAGYWSVFISIPLFQFLMFRWFWRYIVWVLLLFRLSKATLNLLPTHADKAGGLGIIVLTQKSFNLFFVTVSVIISGGLISELTEHPDSFNTIRGELIGFIVLCLVLLLFPLLFFSRKLARTKNEGLLRLSNRGATFSRKFEAEWVNDLPIDKVIIEKQSDPSMVFDYSGIYEAVQQLRVIPVTLRDIISMALLLGIPFIPILFIHFSVAELLQRIMKLVA